MYRVTVETSSSPAPTAPPAGRGFAATNSVNLWDYGINKFNCITVSVKFMLECYN